MKKSIAILILASLTALAFTAVTAERASASRKEASKVRIGIYDSRAVAVAYCGTPLHEAEIKTLDEALKEAKATGIPEKVLACDKAVWEARKRLHRQGFGTYPVDDILAKIPNEVAGIQQNAQATALVSKWDKKGLTKYKHAERVDVTSQLVEVFHLSDKRLKMVEEIQKTKPLSPKAVEKAIEREMKKG